MSKSFETLLEDAVTDYLQDEVDNSDLVYAWNEYCDNEHYDSKLYDTPDIEEIYSFDGGVIDTINAVKTDFDDFDPDMEYFYIDAGGCYISTNDPDDVVCHREMARAIIAGDLECDGLDLDEIKEEVRKECGSYREFKTIDEFKQTIPVKIGESLEFRNKEDTERVVTAMLIEVGLDFAHEPFVVLGRSSFNFSTLFNDFEYRKDDEWVPFGVLDVTDTEKTEDTESTEE